MHRFLIVIAVLTAALIATACAADPEPAPGPATPAGPAATATSPGAGPASNAGGQPAVPEQLRFTARTVDGRDFDGAALTGRPAVLWFWAPWCPKCRAEAEHVAELARANAGRVTFLGVAAQDQVPAMQRFVDEYDVDFTHLADVDAAVWRRFGVTYQPAYAFVDSSGRVEVVKNQLGEDELVGRIAALR